MTESESSRRETLAALLPEWRWILERLSWVMRGQAAIARRQFELSVDPATLAEAVDVLLQCGAKAEVVEQRGVQEIGEGANFAGHLLEEFACFVESALGGVRERLAGLANLGEAEVDGENGLRHAVVEFAADAAALFILELEEFGGELMDGAFRIFHFGDVGEGSDDAEDGAVRRVLRDGIAVDPKGTFALRTPPAEDIVVDGKLGAKNGFGGKFVIWDGAPVDVDGVPAKTLGT